MTITTALGVIANTTVTATAQGKIGHRPSPALARANPGLGFGGALKEPWGIEVRSLDAKSRAYACGLRENDVIKRITVPEKKVSAETTGPENLAEVLKKVGPNDTIELHVRRGKAEVTIEIAGYSPRGFTGIELQRGGKSIPDVCTKDGKVWFKGTAPQVKSYANNVKPKGFTEECETILGARKAGGKIVQFKNDAECDRFLQSTDGGEKVSLYLLKGYKAVEVPMQLKSYDPGVKGSNRRPGSVVHF